MSPIEDRLPPKTGRYGKAVLPTSTHGWTVLCLCGSALLTQAGHSNAGAAEPAVAMEPENAIYKTREERREAGRKHEITEWLTLSGLLEVEYIGQRLGFVDTAGKASEHEPSANVQLVAEIEPLDWAKIELVYEAEKDEESLSHGLDEAIATVELGDFELEAGKFYLPFGEYFSHFVSGPLLEFGETRAKGGVLTYSPSDALDVSAFIYDGKAKRTDEVGREWHWGAAIEVHPTANATFGLSYLADLADSTEGLLDDHDNRYTQRVAGLSAYASAAFGAAELTAEFVESLDAFAELEADRDRPGAWNIEVAFYPHPRFEWALRVEGSDELEDAPDLRAGASLAWHLSDTASLRVEYLYSDYEPGPAEDDEGRELAHSHQLGALLSVAF